MNPIRVKAGEPPYYHRPPKPAKIVIDGNLLLITHHDGNIVEVCRYDRSTFATRVRSKQDAIERAGRHGLELPADSIFIRVFYMELAAYSREQKEVERENKEDINE